MEYAEFNVDFVFFGFGPKIFIFGKFGPKHQYSHFRIKLGSYTNLNMLNSMVIFIYPALDGKHPFWVNVVQKFKTVCLG